jgi:hypothetical protein
MTDKSTAKHMSVGQIVLQFREREVTLQPGGVYEGLEFTVWANPPDGHVAALTRGAALLLVLRRWNVQTTAGEVAPITEDTLGLLPADLLTWLVDEWTRERTSPLASLHSSERRNGTPSIVV